MTRILIDRNTRIAQVNLEELRRGTERVKEMIAIFNEVKGLKNIDNEDDAGDLIGNPIAYLDYRIIKDTGIAVSEVAKPSVEGTAALFNIPYEKIKKELNLLVRHNWVLEHLTYDKERNTFVLAGSSEAAYIKSFEIYTKSATEENIWGYLTEMSSHLTEYAKMFNTSNDVLYQIAQAYGLEVVNKEFEPTPRSLDFVLGQAILRSHFEL